MALAGGLGRGVWMALGSLAVTLGCQGDPVGQSDTDAAAGFGGGIGGAGGNAGSGATGGGAAGGAGGSGGATSFGPGPFGALPSGYCCTSDDECRYRNCALFGGIRMCIDECSHDDGCITGTNQTCGVSGQCEPMGPPTCKPAEQWPLGDKETGRCCIASGDGTAGQECVGNRCIAFGDLSNPFICTNSCQGNIDCPVKYECSPAGFCWPLATLYDCD